MGKSNKKSSSSSSSSKVASLEGKELTLNVNIYINIGTELSTANKKKRKIENKAEKKKLIESAEKSAPTAKKSKKKHKSSEDDDDSSSKDISAEDQKDMEMLDDDAPLHISSKDIAAEEKLVVSTEKSAPTVKKSKKKHKSSNDDDSSSKGISAEDQKAETPAKKLVVSSKKSAPTAKKSKKKQKSSSDDSSSEDISADQDDSPSEDISADPKAETPTKKLLVSSEKSAPIAKKKSSDDSPSEDVSADQKDMRMMVADDSPFFHIYEHFPHENKILPEGSKTLFARDIACPRRRKITQADFKKFFRKVGKVVNVQIKLNDDNEEFVELAEFEFESHNVAKDALERMHARSLFGTLVCLDVSPEGSGPNYNETDLTNERPVIHIAFGNKFESVGLRNKLETLFESCGEIKCISAKRNEATYICAGHAYIVFKDFESLSKALDLDGTEFMGAPMKIRRAKAYVTSV